MSFVAKYLERILQASAAAMAWDNEMQGWKWAVQCNSCGVFEGSFQNGTKEQCRKDITAAGRHYKRAINQEYPAAGWDLSTWFSRRCWVTRFNTPLRCP